MPWRLCTSAEPWRSRFRESLLSLVRETGAKGVKVDAADLWCASEQHDHARIYSVYANTSALADTFGALVEAGAPFLMTYWGLRSPWWLRWAATLWERDYLVEAAGPSGVPSWSLRLGVASSQDIGQQRSWRTIPAHQQDSWASGSATPSGPVTRARPIGATRSRWIWPVDHCSPNCGATSAGWTIPTTSAPSTPSRKGSARSSSRPGGASRSAARGPTRSTDTVGRATMRNWSSSTGPAGADPSRSRPRMGGAAPRRCMRARALGRARSSRTGALVSRRPAAASSPSS